ncbi:hypothetical protein EST38_g1349 [Candolleomyces aberdarensis]|uniref:Vacuolar fusion protein MON1 n=1 Tax=Candolleomyces aberdarensis TaxID=2316362 RepID=A0A4Q2DZK8_9AGAR|nr:hypothetical protein EST38_g1349 [Candolleomyces aberdarensis]
MDMAEGILVQEMDTESVDRLEADEGSNVDQPMGVSESAQLLREQLKKTFTSKADHQEATDSTRLLEKDVAITELTFNAGSCIFYYVDRGLMSAASRYSPREYFVLTNAGKPVFISRPGKEDNDNTASVIGVMQALISVFIDDGDKIRCVNAGRTRITFLLRSPLYYVCVSSWGEPESTVRGN